MQSVVDYNGQCARRTFLTRLYLNTVKANRVKNLYTAWKGHFHTGTPRWGKSHLIEGLLDEEVSIDWDRVISWLEELLPRQNPPVMPSGIVSQFWDTDCAMFRAVRARQAVVPHVEPVEEEEEYISDTGRRSDAESDRDRDAEHDSDDGPANQEYLPVGVEEEEQEEQEEDEDEDEDLFAPDAPDVPRSTQPRPPLSRETTVPSEQGIPHPDTAKDDDPMSALTPLPSSLNATQAGEASASPVKEVQPGQASGSPVKEVQPGQASGSSVNGLQPGQASGSSVNGLQPGQASGSSVNGLQPGQASGSSVNGLQPGQASGSPVNELQPGQVSGSPVNELQPGQAFGSAVKEVQSTAAVQPATPSGECAAPSAQATPQSQQARIRYVLEKCGFLNRDYVPPTSVYSPPRSRPSSPQSDLEPDDGDLEQWEITPDDPMWEYYSQAKARQSHDSRPLFGDDDLPWDGHGIAYGQGGVVALVKDYRKDPDGKTPRMVVFMSNVWLCYVARTQVFVASAHTLIDSLLEDPLFLEGDFYVAVPMTVGGEDCVHVVGAVDAARDVHMAPQPFQVRLSLIDDDSGVVSHTVRNAFFSVSLLINPPIGMIPQKRPRSDSWPDGASGQSTTHRLGGGALGPDRLRHAGQPGPGQPVPVVLDSNAVQLTGPVHVDRPAKRTTHPSARMRQPTPGTSRDPHPSTSKANVRPVEGTRLADLAEDDEDEVMEISPPTRPTRPAHSDRGDAASLPKRSSKAHSGPPGESTAKMAHDLTGVQLEVLTYLKGTEWHDAADVLAIRSSGKGTDNGSRTVEDLRVWAWLVGNLMKAPTPFSDKKKYRITSAVVGAFLEHSEDWTQNAYQVYRYLLQEPRNDAMRQAIAQLGSKPLGMAAFARCLKGVLE